MRLPLSPALRVLVTKHPLIVVVDKVTGSYLHYSKPVQCASTRAIHPPLLLGGRAHQAHKTRLLPAVLTASVQLRLTGLLPVRYRFGPMRLISTPEMLHSAQSPVRA